ncbi:MAG: hypothetical protein ACKO37_03295 [Vampirovibrionales bacterium]
MLQFMYNGIKASDGKLQKAFYVKHTEDITIYKEMRHDDYSFTKEVASILNVRNDSDMMSDYSETDSIRLSPSHPFYQNALKAHELQQEKQRKRTEKHKKRA